MTNKAEQKAKEAEAQKTKEAADKQKADDAQKQAQEPVKNQSANQVADQGSGQLTGDPAAGEKANDVGDTNQAGSTGTRASPHGVDPAFDFDKAKKTRTVGDSEVPEPLTQPPVHGSVVYLVSDGSQEGAAPYERIVWSGTDYQHEQLGKGLIHDSQEAAEFHSNARGDK